LEDPFPLDLASLDCQPAHIVRPIIYNLFPPPSQLFSPHTIAVNLHLDSSAPTTFHSSFLDLSLTLFSHFPPASTKRITPAMNGSSSASNFWAQKSREVKTSAAPTHTLTKPVKAHGPSSEVKNRMVLKGKPPAAALTAATHRDSGMTNGAPATPTAKKHDWADSEDDDDFIASFSAQKNPRITTLELEVTEKDARIEALESVVDAKDAHIAQLEDVVDEKEQQIDSLEADAQDKDVQIEKLRRENHTQFLYVQELVGEVDEKQRRVDELETELDNKGARIRELEMDLKSQTEVSAIDIDKDDLLKLPAQTETATADSNHAAPVHSAEVEQPVSDATPVVSPSTEPTQADKPLGDATERPTTPDKEPAGPAINNSKFPKLWSPEMVKKVAPIERPKVLKMAIDTSKYGKKPSPAAKKPQHMNYNDFSVPTYGQASKSRAKTDVVPKFQIDRDIRHMPHAERVLYANGPEVTVMLGPIKLAIIPKYVLMQCSGKALKYFTEHPDDTAITFPADSMSAEAAKAHLQWMDEMTYQGRVYSLTLNGDEKFDTKNLKICQAARVMGLNNTYVGHFTKIVCDRVRSNKISMEFMSLICDLAYPENDPIFDCLANNLVNQQMSKAPKKPEDLETLLTKCPRLQAKMMKIERRVKYSRAADKRKGGKPQDGSRTREASRGIDGEKART
jgi:hypothetical protein